MSNKYEFVKAAYERGSCNKAMVRNAVAKNWITREEYALITGEEYNGAD